MIKKIFVLFFSLSMLFVFVGCDNTQTDPTDGTTQSTRVSTATQTSTTAQSTQVSTTTQSAQASTTTPGAQIDENLKQRLLSDTFSPTPYSNVKEIETPLSDEEMRAIIAKIPSDKYEVYPDTHTIPVSATLYKDGEVITISADDPRLIQLTNFFNNCVYYSKCSYTQGFYSLPYIETILSAPFRLELNYIPYGNDAMPYGKETTGSDMFVVTQSFTAINHSRIGYDEANYPFRAVGFLPLYKNYNLLDLFGF